jgi:hypothetical protein
MTDIAKVSEVLWYKSSFSGNQGGNCVEVADLPQGKLVRDSKRPEGAMLRFSAGEWASFVASVRSGEVRV